MATHQSKAQSHWSTIRSSSLHSRSRHDDTPVHNLRPPKFAPKALSVIVEVCLTLFSLEILILFMMYCRTGNVSSQLYYVVQGVELHQQTTPTN